MVMVFPDIKKTANAVSNINYRFRGLKAGLYAVGCAPLTSFRFIVTGKQK